jgi:hypothetical protein
MSSSTLFCCTSIQGYKSMTTSHEHKFKEFMAWAKHPRESTQASEPRDLTSPPTSHVIQLVRQVNYGPLESKRYFVPIGERFVEVAENDLIQANFQKLNTYVAEPVEVVLYSGR